MELKRVYSFVIVLTFLLSVMIFGIQSTAQNVNETGSQNSDYNVVISSDTVLHGNLFADNLTINPGVTLVTNGYSIILSGNFENYGFVCAGYNPHSVGVDGYSLNYLHSLGGSGGGASFDSSYSVSAYHAGATMAPCGTALPDQTGGSGHGVSFSTVIGYTTISNISKWFKNGIQQYISGAAGGSVIGYYGSMASGGLGSYGIYIQANTVNEGNIIAAGNSVYDDCLDASQGAGGGGAIIIAYGSGGCIPGTVSNNGGIATPECSNYYMAGGQGGNGAVFSINYQSGHEPVPVTISGPQWAFNGAMADYEEQETLTSAGQTYTQDTYYVNQTITDVNIPLQEFQLDNFNNGQNSTCTLYFNNPQSLFAINATNLNDLNSGQLPGTGQIEIGNEITVNSPTITTGVDVSVNSGSYLTDEINFYYGDSGNQANIWISQSSGMVIKFSVTQVYTSSSYSYKETESINLIKTNIAMSQPAPKNNIVLYVIIGGIIAVIVVASFMVYRGGYLSLEKFHRPSKIKENQKNSSNDSIRKLRELRDSGLITKEDFDKRLEEMLSKK